MLNTTANSSQLAKVVLTDLMSHPSIYVLPRGTPRQDGADTLKVKQHFWSLDCRAS